MSLPPQVLRIKRKRTDDPVDSLYLEPDAYTAKRRAVSSSHDFVFRRLIPSINNEASSARSSDIPAVIATKPGEEREILQRLRQRRGLDRVSTHSIGKSARHKSSTLPRRFQLSRAATLSSTPNSPAETRRNRKLDVAIFVEQSEHSTSSKLAETSHDVAMVDRLDVSMPQDTSYSPQKRPSTPATNPRAIRSRVEAHENQQSGLYEALQRYAAEEFQTLEAEKLPNPEFATSVMTTAEDTTKGDLMDLTTDETIQTGQDENDFIYDTYVRYANTLEALPYKSEDSNRQGSIAGNHGDSSSFNETYGYLVIPETEQTLWETFYATGDESESEHDWDSEEDDENHENWYGADYPEEEEVSSTDDIEETPYRYRRGSDDVEEWDSEEADSSDQSEEQKPNWRNVSQRMANFSL